MVLTSSFLLGESFFNRSKSAPAIWTDDLRRDILLICEKLLSSISTRDLAYRYLQSIRKDPTEEIPNNIRYMPIITIRLIFPDFSE
jgi:hypothetical protein